MLASAPAATHLPPSARRASTARRARPALPRPAPPRRTPPHPAAPRPYRALLLASGPASRWTLRAKDAPPPDAIGLADGDDGEAGDGMGGTDGMLRWMAGETLMLAVEATDESGNVDTDLDSVVLIESETHVQGRGLLRVAGGVGHVALRSNKAGPIFVSVHDGGFSGMSLPPELSVTFYGGPAVGIGIVVSKDDAIAGEDVEVAIEARDQYGNVSRGVSCVVVVVASHGYTFVNPKGPVAAHSPRDSPRSSRGGDSSRGSSRDLAREMEEERADGGVAVELEDGVGTLILQGDAAAAVAVRAVEVHGAPEISDLSHQVKKGLEEPSHAPSFPPAHSPSRPLARPPTRPLARPHDSEGSSAAARTRLSASPRRRRTSATRRVWSTRCSSPCHRAPSRSPASGRS